LCTTWRPSGGTARHARADLELLCRYLNAYRVNPGKSRRLASRARFDRIFHRRTGTLDRLLRPEIPLHTDGSENDNRCCVTRRKLGAGTRSDAERDCRDDFLGL
jgi:hypothetical protein